MTGATGLPTLLSSTSGSAGNALRATVAVYAAAFALATISSLIFTYAVRARAQGAGLFDRSDARKLHERDVPRVGGVGIVLAVVVAGAIIIGLFGPRQMTAGTRGLLVVLAGGLAIHLVGLYDDLYELAARWKLLTQVVIAILVFAAGVRMTTLSLPFLRIIELGPVAGLVLTVVWFVGITNAFNLIDGLDGLAAGAALFALTTMFVVAIVNGRYGAALATLTLAGAVLGCLYYNFYPATIFLGDSGSLFLGFMLAGIGVLSAQKSPTVVAVAIPVVSLGLPVLDTALAIVRRFLRRQPIFAADRGHIHHRLLGRGYSPRTVVMVLYGACALLALAGMLLVNDGGQVALVLVTIGLGVGFTIQRLRIYELEEFGRLLKRGVRQRHSIARGVRLREASARLSGLGELSAVFASLGEVFAADGCRRAEVRLAVQFLGARRAGVALPVPPARPARRADDEVVVWAWEPAEDLEERSSWWHVSVPLLDGHGARFGSLLFWQTREAIDAPFLHFHLVAGELRERVEAKLLALWPVDGAAGAEDDVADSGPAGARGATGAGGGRVGARGWMPGGSGSAVPAT